MLQESLAPSSQYIPLIYSVERISVNAIYAISGRVRGKRKNNLAKGKSDMISRLVFHRNTHILSLSSAVPLKLFTPRINFSRARERQLELLCKIQKLDEMPRRSRIGHRARNFVAELGGADSGNRRRRKSLLLFTSIRPFSHR